MKRLSLTQIILTIPIAFFMLVPGLAKFLPKFHGLFEQQIALSEIPFPELAFFMGQWSEIIVGLLLCGLLLFYNRIPSHIAPRLFALANLATLPIMAVAVYVHLHPAVPAEVLPFESKPATLAYALLALAVINIYITLKNSKQLWKKR